ncbi:MAG: hypothetical protein FJ220_01470 [Kiritimatiellaceae bacterium]|nr:hypothetical protein [Kiritimatiellaceae bacterium]
MQKRYTGEQNTLLIAEQTFARIASQFPTLQLIRENDAPVELAYTIPVQPGVKQEIHLNLQNIDELHFSVGHFWLEWFPCTEPKMVENYVEAVCGYLSGTYRIVEHFRGQTCIRAELQQPTEDGWKTIGTWKTVLAWLPGQQTELELRNI